MSTAPSDPPTGVGQLGLWDTVSIIVGIVIGTSIFKVPELIFRSASNPWMGLIVWTAGGALAFIGALCYAELATTYPRAGGDYVYLSRAFGPWAGFLFGWAQLTLVLTASIGAMAVVFGEYAVSIGFPDLTPYVDVEAPLDVLYAGIAVIGLTFLNLLGVTLGKWAQNVLSAAKVLGLAGIVIVGFVWGQADMLVPTQQATATTEWSFGALAIILVLYAYGGWNDAAFVAAEVRQPRRNIPRALFLGTLSITLIYLLVNAAYIAGLGWDEVRRLGPGVSPVPVRVMERTGWDFAGRAISILVMVSALGAANGLIFAGARVYATLGTDYRLFAWLGAWRPGRGAPIVALLLQALITLGLLAALGTAAGHRFINEALSQVGIQAGSVWQPGAAFQKLVDHTAPIFWFFFLLTGLSLFALREKDPHLPRPFTVPLYPVVPLIFCSMCLYMLYASIAYVGVRSLLAFGVLWVGVFLFLLARLVGMRVPAPELAPAPQEEAPSTFARVPTGRRVL
jgi:APA family basic amino acid/polyamine antiporter